MLTILLFAFFVIISVIFDTSIISKTTFFNSEILINARIWSLTKYASSISEFVILKLSSFIVTDFALNELHEVSKIIALTSLSDNMESFLSSIRISEAFTKTEFESSSLLSKDWLFILICLLYEE